MAVARLAAGDSTKTLEEVQRIPLAGKEGRLDHIVIDSTHRRLLAANKTNGTLDVVDLAQGKLLRQVQSLEDISGLAYARNQIASS